MLPIRSEFIVAFAFLGVAEHLISFVDFLEFFLGHLLVLGRVRVVLAREFAESGFDLSLGCGLGDSECLVVIAELR